MKVDDQRVVETVLAQVIEGVGPKARQHSHPDEGCEQKKRVPIRARACRKTSNGYCCYFRIPRPTRKIASLELQKFGSIGGASAVARRIADFGDAGVRVCSKPKSMLLAKCAVVGGLQD